MRVLCKRLMRSRRSERQRWRRQHYMLCKRAISGASDNVGSLACSVSVQCAAGNASASECGAASCYSVRFAVCVLSHRSVLCKRVMRVLFKRAMHGRQGER